MAKWLIAHGHTVVVITPFFGGYYVDGVPVICEGADNRPLWENADVVFTQLNYTGTTINRARYYGKKVVHFARNDNEYDMVRYRAFADHFIVYNSEWVKKSLDYPLRSFVMPPLVDYRHYDVGGDPFDRPYVTLINHNENKGGYQVLEMAKRMPDVQFLMVQGGYGVGVKEDLPNVTYWPNQIDVREVYKATRLLLMPSKYESWGRTCTEAMANGIPAIHSDAPGLVENAAGQQLMIRRDNVNAWVDSINIILNDPNIYKLYSDAGRTRAKELDPELVMASFDKWLKRVVTNKQLVAA
ncbi:MAG TPA: glycosyltransferase family 4 protein [Chitinophagaceae bacterium]|nr:glycosyltransferase family 4 protein [Chitinophagaceae bacterium]